jgi:hypothetical protein
MKRFALIALLVVATLMVQPFGTESHASELAASARFHQKFRLLGGSAEDRFVLFFPIEITGPGMVRVYIDPTGMSQGTGERASVWLVDARMFGKLDVPTWKKWVIKINEYNALEWVAGDEIREFVKDVKKFFGKDDKPAWYHGGQMLSKTVPLEHAVDDSELRNTGGRYVAVLRNPSAREYYGSVLISYPGDRWDVDPDLEKAYERKPDLAVEKLSLDGQNRVVVIVANNGPGWLYQVRWSQQGAEAIQLALEVDGKTWGGATLAAIDPQKTLVLGGNRIAYATGLTLSQPARVTAVIDSNQVVAETDERNNRHSETLTPSSGDRQRTKRQPDGQLASAGGTIQSVADLPDLVVSDIFLDSRKRVAVRVQNIGADLNAEAWQREPQVYLKLLMNGRSWTTVPLRFLDPSRALHQAGGSATYTSDQAVRTALEITAVIDEGNRVAEKNEDNNTLTRALAP